MDSDTAAQLGQLEREELAKNAPLTTHEIGGSSTGAVARVHTFEREGKTIPVITVEKVDGTFEAFSAASLDLREKLIEGRYVTGWTDDGKPSGFTSLGPVAPGDLVFVRRLADKALPNGYSMKRFEVRRPGSPESKFDTDTPGVGGRVIYDPETSDVPY